MASPQLQKIADSAGLKVAQYLISGVMIPAVWWYGGTVLSRIDRVEQLLVSADKNNALLAARVERLEAMVPQRNQELSKLNDQVVELKLEITLLRGRK
jgi:cell division protein FtsB